MVLGHTSLQENVAAVCEASLAVGCLSDEGKCPKSCNSERNELHGESEKELLAEWLVDRT